jgi:formyl-CoA transferase
MLVQSEAGLLSLTGPESEPSRVGVSIADIAAGMYLYSGALTALLQRARTGQGVHVKVSLFEALAEWMGSPAYYTKYGGSEPRRVGAEHATIAPYGPYQTSDGQTLVVAIQSQHEWRSFCAVVLDDELLADDQRFVRNSDRVANRRSLNEIIEARFARLDASAAASLLDRARVAHARMRNVAEFLAHPVLRERHRWADVQSPAGTIEMLVPPVDVAGVEPRLDPIPALGEHTEAILLDLGYSADAIESLRLRGVV